MGPATGRPDAYGGRSAITVHQVNLEELQTWPDLLRPFATGGAAMNCSSQWWQERHGSSFEAALTLSLLGPTRTQTPLWSDY